MLDGSRDKAARCISGSQAVAAAHRWIEGRGGAACRIEKAGGIGRPAQETRRRAATHKQADKRHQMTHEELARDRLEGDTIPTYIINLQLSKLL